MDNENGRVNAYYVRGPSRTVHTIPFSKKTVDKILNDPNPFGADSQNITDLNSVTFYGKFDGERGISNYALRMTILMSSSLLLNGIDLLN